MNPAFTCAIASRRMPGLRAELISAAGIPSSRNWLTWSSISEISGETTIVSPSDIAAGSW